ncbi:MAG: hypothetical protein TREMPRED_000691 [Tremellales sp. Tagirdzhanova-0007]|nr:MAG: hypothetical protein TREMPRED_000691 [Tremellales sp. Tagirdzhanova-0007]
MIDLQIGTRQITPIYTDRIAPHSPCPSSTASSVTLDDRSTAPTSRTAPSSSPKPIPSPTTEYVPVDPADLSKRADDIIARLTCKSGSAQSPCSDDVQRRADDVISRIETDARAREVIERLEKQQAPSTIPGMAPMARPFFGPLPMPMPMSGMRMMMPQMVMGPGGVMIPVGPIMGPPPGVRLALPSPGPVTAPFWRLTPPTQAVPLLRPPLRFGISSPSSIYTPSSVLPAQSTPISPAPRFSTPMVTPPILSPVRPISATSEHFGPRPPSDSSTWPQGSTSRPNSTNSAYFGVDRATISAASSPTCTNTATPVHPTAYHPRSSHHNKNAIFAKSYPVATPLPRSPMSEPSTTQTANRILRSPFPKDSPPSVSQRPQMHSSPSSEMLRSSARPIIEQSAPSPTSHPNPFNQIYLGSLPPATTLPSLRTAFAPLSPIVSIELRSPYAMIEFEQAGAAERAVEVYDEGYFAGAMIRVERAVGRSSEQRPSPSLKRTSETLTASQNPAKRPR